MSVVIETTLGDITVDLYLEQRPVSCLNFLKLCKMKYYNFNLFHTIRSGFIAQTGDPSGGGSGGQSIFGIMEGPEKRFFSGEKMPKIRHTNAGLLSMVCTDDMMVGSQFFFTLAPDLDSLDGVHCVIGEVTEGHEVLRQLNEVICDETHRPYQDVRITHTVVLEDPFNNPPGFHAPSRSPSPSAERLKGGRIAPDEELDETQGKSVAEIQEMIEEKEAKARATILEIVGDLPDADIAPPENVLFVCKLNPVTTDEDLEIIFSRFGTIVSCEVIRDKKTGDSLQYAFIEFSDKKSCEEAYFKMDNVLIDDRRIHVDFSQSVSKMRWLGKGRGVQHFDNEDSKDGFFNNKQKHSFHQNHDQGQNRYQNDQEKSRYIRHEDKTRHKEDGRNKEKVRRYDNDIKEKDKQYKSRSHSVERSRHKRQASRDRSSTSNNRNNDEEVTLKKNIKSENYKDVSERRDGNHRKVRETNSDAYRSKNENVRSNDHSSFRNSNSSHNADRYRKQEKLSERNNHEKEVHVNRHRNKDNTNKRRSSSRDNSREHKTTQSSEDKETYRHNKRLKKEEKHHEPQTPSPVRRETKKKDKLKTKHSEKEKKNSKKVRSTKKKRKPSTSSSSSDSSESSTSTSESSSSSGSDRKKKRTKKKKKYSSSSSSDSSDSSSSSSDSSSDSTSSSSDSDTKRKKSKKSGKNKSGKKSRKS